MSATIRVRIGEKMYAVSTASGDFQYLLWVVKAIPGRTWNPTEKIWEIPEERAAMALRRLREGYAKVPAGQFSTAMRFPLDVREIESNGR